MFSWFTMPDIASTTANIGIYSVGIFDELFPLLYIIAGLLIGGMIVAKLISVVIRSAKKVVGGRGGGKRRRR